MIVYTNWCIPKRFSAYTIGPVVLIRPQFKGDVGLREHELTHVRQFKETWGWNGVRYLFSKKWRYAYELEAYREQLKYSPGNERNFAHYLATNYNLAVTAEQAEADLRA